MSKLARANMHALQQQIRKVLSQIPDQLGISATPEFPLVFNTAMPEGHAFDHGNIGIRFSAMSLEGGQQVVLHGINRTPQAQSFELQLQLPELRLNGQYSVDAIHVPQVTLDHGGSLMDFDDAADYQPAGSNVGGIEPLSSDQKQAMLDQARAQKVSLRSTPNGQDMLETFNEHNETFNTVFVTSQAARTAWAAEGVTKAMALDTHQSLNDDAVVNPKQKLYAPNVTYNSNAFNQQLQMVVNTVATDPDFNPFDPNAQLDPNSPFVKASLAAMTFGYSVNNTGNDKSTVTELKPSSVYHEVNTQAPAQQATVAELKNIIDQGAGAGGAVETAQKNKWRILDEEDRGKVRRFLFHAIQERLEKMQLKPVALWQGDCSATIRGINARVLLTVDARGKCQVGRCCFDIPAFALEIDDAAWHGEVGQKTRERLNQIFFIKRLLQDKLHVGLKQWLELALPSLNVQVLELAVE
ncbi:TPA: hypothetical protein ACNUUR_000719 [Aeromonas salmonicida]